VHRHGTRRALAASLALGCWLSLARGSAEAAAQHPGGLRILGHRPISADTARRPHFETHLAVNPEDPRHMLAASMLLTADAKIGSSVYVTFDGGRRWTRGRTSAAGRRMFISGDPLVYFSPKGTPLFVAGGRTEDDRPITFLSRSGDGGRTWSGPQLHPYRDRPWLGFDTTAKALSGSIYFAGTYGSIVLSRSMDDARSFSLAELVTRDRDGPNPEAPVRGGALADLQVTPDGVVVIPFLAGTDMADSVPSQDSVQVWKFRLLVSDDGGQTFGPVRAGPDVRFSTSYRGIRATTAPRTAMDHTRGPHRGRLYLVYTEYERGRFVVRLARTDDLGKTWATTVVSDDTTRRDPSNTAIAVNRDGIVAVIWNDRRDDPRGDCFRLYGAISVDGGERFLPNVRLSEAPVCPNAPANWQLSAWYQYDDWTDPAHPRPGLGLTATVPTRFPNGGDTHGLAADRDGVFHAAYIDGRRGGMDLWLVDFAVDSGLVARTRGKNAAATTTAPKPVPAEWDDVTQELEFAVGGPAIDFAAGTLAITLRVVNKTGRPARGPLTVVLDQLLDPANPAMGLRNFRVANADSGGTAEGASWVFEVPADRVLGRGEQSLSRTLEFRFDGGVPAEPRGYFEPKFRIYGRGRD
jgi:hypothetical protein